MKEATSARIREFWPVVRSLRREGVSWRKVPLAMHQRLGLPVVSHSCSLKIAMQIGHVRDLQARPICPKKEGDAGALPRARTLVNGTPTDVHEVDLTI